MDQSEFLKRFDGIRWIGDIHGDANVRSIVAEARDKNYAIGLIGDLTDQNADANDDNNDSADVVRLLIELDAQGVVLLSPGNHCNKLLRYLTKWREGNGDEAKFQLKHGLAQTLEEIMAASDRDHLIDGFIRIVSASYVWNRLGDHVFVHGGGSSRMFTMDSPTMAVGLKDRKLSGLFSRAMYGETDGTFTEDGFPTRLYNWIDRIPEGKTVVMGHDKKPDIMWIDGELGGRVFFIDTGAGKGGKLSFIDFAVEDLI